MPAPAVGTLGEVVCHVDVVLGSGTISVRQCLELRQHAIIRLSEPAGADMQVTVNGIPVAQGEVVIVDDTVAIRVTEILAPPSAESPA